jgi:chromosome segregation ATPase
MSTVNNYENPEKFTQKLVSLKQQLPSILDDYNKYSVFYNKNPDYNEYQQSFDRIQGNLNQLNSELFMLSNNVQTETDEVNKYLNQLNKLITIEKSIRSDLKKQLGNAESDKNATTEMIDNYKEMYNNGYLRNWGLLLSIILAGFAISKVYSSKIVNPIPIK